MTEDAEMRAAADWKAFTSGVAHPPTRGDGLDRAGERDTA
jgi:hypothetical protein